MTRVHAIWTARAITGKASLLVVALVLLTGCASVPDDQAAWRMNERLSALEGKTTVQRQPAAVPTAAVPRSSAEEQGWYGGNNFVFIYVPTRTGARVPVKIFQKGPDVFSGPRGELYYGMPTVEQLKVEYPR